MGKKGKGRQSGGFQCKSQRAAHTKEWQEQAQELTVRRNRHRDSTEAVANKASAQRPRLTQLGQLKGILRERQFEDTYELMERRRRAGFAPARNHDPEPTQPVKDNPPGWLLTLGNDSSSPTMSGSIGTRNRPPDRSVVVETLHRNCVKVLSRYILEYLEYMGRHGLHAALSLLQADTLTELCVAVSKSIGFFDDLVYAIGKHSHVLELCFRSRLDVVDGGVLTDQGLLELVPRLPQNANCYLVDGEEHSLEDWEDAYKTDLVGNDKCQTRQPILVDDSLQLEGVNIGLKRLELLDCLYISSRAVLQLLEKCGCITHLSLAGSLQAIDEGIQVMQALPDLLPHLQVLDLTRCGWVTPDLLDSLKLSYTQSSGRPPIVYAEGCYVPQLSGQVQTTRSVDGRADW